LGVVISPINLIIRNITDNENNIAACCILRPISISELISNPKPIDPIEKIIPNIKERESNNTFLSIDLFDFK
jgi:hypothetical protein